MELADKMSFPSMAVTVDVNVVFFNSIAIQKKKKKILHAVKTLSQLIGYHYIVICSLKSTTA